MALKDERLRLIQQAVRGIKAGGVKLTIKNKQIKSGITLNMMSNMYSFFRC